MIQVFNEMFTYTFILRAIVVGLLVSLCASILGVSLVLKRYSMIGDGLSHVAFGALGIATVLNIAPLKIALPTVIIVAFLLLKISEKSKLKGDSLIALVSASSLAIGIFAVSLKTGVNTDIYSYLFGSILAIFNTDLIISVICSILVVVLFIIFYNKIFAVTFDESFARAIGVKVNLYNMLISILTAVTIVLGMRIMGSLLISSLIIFPALTSMQIFKKFKLVVLSSAIISIICFMVGITISYVFGTPAGASIVIVNLIVFLIFWVMSFIRQKN